MIAAGTSDAISVIKKKPRLLWPDVLTMTRLSYHQQEQLSEALSARVGVLAGTPGTGKSVVTGSLIRAIARQYGGHVVAVAAPTGKAAVRMNGLMTDLGLSVQASTIHRLLEVGRNGHDGKGWGFQRNKFNPLSQMFYFIDEFSMCDTNLCAALFSALPDEAHVLLIGDPYQLPPVGHGAPLRDMIASGATGYGELTEIWRNSGDIVRSCLKIKNGEYFRPNTQTLDPASGKNWMHFELTSPAAQIARMQHLIHTIPAKYHKMFDVQVICALNTKGDLSRQNLNQILQAQLNPNNPIQKNRRFAVRDKVICVRTCTLDLAEVTVMDGHHTATATGFSEIVSNGEIGQVIAMDAKRAVVKLLYPLRHVVIPLSSGGGEDSAGNAFDLAYAITCHKAQGSQVPVIIEMIDDSYGAGFVTSREWHYTGISRAEDLCISIGKWDVLMHQCKIQSLQKRKTRLTEILKGEIT